MLLQGWDRLYGRRDRRHGTLLHLLPTLVGSSAAVQRVGLLLAVPVRVSHCGGGGGGGCGGAVLVPPALGGPGERGESPDVVVDLLDLIVVVFGAV